MSTSSCPFCCQIVPSDELQRHANSHFEDDDYNDKQQQLARDFELAQQMALSSSSSSSSSHGNSDQVTMDMLHETEFEESLDANKLSCDEGTTVKEELNINEKISFLTSLQNRSAFYKVEGGLISLLRTCLELESFDSTSILSGYVDHYHSIESEDLGWGCGWRNIQMLSSHLLMQRLEAREVLFGGSGIIPDIPSLQRWLEIAWERGFDIHGAQHFNYKIYGKKHWIGTTECAALLRSFGLHARIVDFGPKECESLYLSVPGSSNGTQILNSSEGNKRKEVQVYGPLDRYLVRRKFNVHQNGSSSDERSSCLQISHGDGITKSKFTEKGKGHQALVDWIWNYFSDGRICKNYSQRVIISEKSPLFFQHDGHSRTIVGIQVKHQHNGMQQYNLLILDPAHRTKALERSLKENIGWQKLIKRGIHTLNEPKYQLCYIDTGIAAGVDMELLKTINSIFIEF